MNRPARRFQDALTSLDSIFAECATENNPKKREVLLSWIVIKLHDQWNFRSRQIILESYGHSEQQMCEFIRNNWSTRKKMQIGFEPDWHIPNNTIRAARLLNVADIQQIQNAIGAVTYIDDIRWTRNAIVHNIPVSFQKYYEMTLSRYGIKNIPPYLLPMTLYPNTGNTFYEDWCDELASALRLAYTA